jgi:hypothetical protein
MSQGSLDHVIKLHRCPDHIQTLHSAWLWGYETLGLSLVGSSSIFSAGQTRWSNTVLFPAASLGGVVRVCGGVERILQCLKDSPNEITRPLNCVYFNFNMSNRIVEL